MLNNKALAKLIKAATKGSLYHQTTANGTTLTTWTGNATIIAEADIMPVKGTKYITSAAIDYAATTGDFSTGEDVEADDVISVSEDKYSFVCEVEYRTLKEATTFAAGKHALDKLTAVHFNANANVIEALDGNRIYTRRVQEIATEATIPADVFRFNGINENVKIYAGEHNYMLCGDGFTIIGNLYEGQYFKVYEIMKCQEDGNTRVTVDVDNFVDVMKTLKAVKSKNPVVFNVTREGIEYYLDIDGIETRGSIDAKVEGTPMLIGLNPKYLFDAVNVINTKRAYITLNNQKAPIFIEDEGFIYNNVILPVNIDIDFYKSIFSKEAAKETEEGQTTETEAEAETVAEKKEEAAAEATEATEATTEKQPETSDNVPAESTTETAASTTISEGNKTIMKETKQEVKATAEAAEKPETGADKIAEIVTAKIIDSLNKGVIPWDKPWTGTPDYFNGVTKKPYSLLNQVLLYIQGGKKGQYRSFKQWKDAGYSIKKGSKCYFVTFWKVYSRQAKDDDGEPLFNEDGSPKINNFPMLRYYNVFSSEQVQDKDGNGPVPFEFPKVEISNTDFDSVLEAYYKAEGVEYREIEQDRAYYSPLSDSITLPLREQFKSESGYYHTKAHETVHSTGAKKRLNRQLANVAGYGSADYGKEELVADMGANILCGMFGLFNDHEERNTIAYCKGWADAFGKDPKMIISATSRAQKAVDYIMQYAEGEPDNGPRKEEGAEAVAVNPWTYMKDAYKPLPLMLEDMHHGKARERIYKQHIEEGAALLADLEKRFPLVEGGERVRLWWSESDYLYNLLPEDDSGRDISLDAAEMLFRFLEDKAAIENITGYNKTKFTYYPGGSSEAYYTDRWDIGDNRHTLPEYEKQFPLSNYSLKARLHYAGVRKADNSRTAYDEAQDAWKDEADALAEEEAETAEEIEREQEEARKEEKEAAADEALTLYRYGMPARPCDIGCQPSGFEDFEDVDRNETGFYSIVTYSRKLSPEEIEAFELVEIEGA